MPIPLRPLTRILALTAGSLVSLFAFDAALFRTGLYARIAEPDSSTGMFELTLDREQRRPLTAAHEVLILGDSRMAEGFSALLATQTIDAPATWHFSSAAVPGMTQRCWYYLIRDLDPHATRYQTIVLPMDDYADLDGPEDIADREADLHWLINRLRWTDTWDFANSFPDPAIRARVLRGSLLKGTIYQQDVVHYLEHTHARAMKVDFWRNIFLPNLDQYTGRPETIAPLPAPPTSTLPPQEGRIRRYRQQWLTRVLDHYRHQPSTEFLFFRVPGAPYLTPEPPTPPGAFIQQIQSRPNVRVLDAHTFDSLQQSDNFFDATHLNARGRRLFTTQLARDVAAGH